MTFVMADASFDSDHVAFATASTKKQKAFLNLSSKRLLFYEFAATCCVSHSASYVVPAKGLVIRNKVS